MPGQAADKEPKARPTDPLQLYLHEHHPATRGYQLPPSGPIASVRGIQASLKVAHPIRAGATQRSTTVDIVTLLKRHAKYRGSPEQDPERYDTVYGQWNHFYECINGLNGRIRKEGASGFPECYTMSTKGHELQDPTAAWNRYRLVASQVHEAIREPVQRSHQRRGFSRDWLCGAPFMVIGKNEPHSEEKVQQGRFRVLQIGGLNDHIWLATFARSFKDTASDWSGTDSAVGADCSNQTGLSELMLHFMRTPSGLTSSDCKAYEFTVDEMGWLAFVCVCSFHNGSLEIEELEGLKTDLFDYLATHPSSLVRSALLYALCKSNPYVVTGDGQEYELLDHDGSPLLWRNPSGHPGTTLVSTASRQLMEVTLARLAGVTDLYMITCGDDTVSNVPVRSYAENAASIGKKLTDVLDCRQHIEFMGYRFYFNGQHMYDRVDKALISYLHSPRGPPQEAALRMVLHPDLAEKVITLGRQPPCGNPAAPEAVEEKQETQTDMYTNQLKTKLSDLSEVDKNYLRTALCDPNLKTPTGIPDRVDDYTVVKKVVVDDVIDFTNQGSHTQMDIIMWPFVRKQTLGKVDIQREAEVSYGMPFPEILVGGTGIYVNEENQSPFAATSADGTFQMPNNGPATIDGKMGQVQTIEDEYLGGKLRVIGSSVKVTSAGAEAYQSGTSVAWEQDFTPSEGYVLSQDKIERNENAAETGGEPTPGAHVRRMFWSSVYPLPPNSNSEINQLRRSEKLGKAELGCYLIGNYHHTENSTMAPVLRNVLLDDGMNELTRPATFTSESISDGYDYETNHQRSGFCSGPLMAESTDNKYAMGEGTDQQERENSVRRLPCRQYYSEGAKMRGVRFSGLNTTAPGPAKMRVTTTFYIEVIPNASDLNMATVSKPSPPYSPAALDRLSQTQATMKFAWLAEQNGKGDVTKAITNFLSTPVANTPKFDKISKAAAKTLLGTTNPLVHMIPGYTAGQVIAGYADQRKRGKTATQAAKATILPAARGAGKAYLLSTVLPAAAEAVVSGAPKHQPSGPPPATRVTPSHDGPHPDHWAEVNSYIALTKTVHYNSADWQRIYQWRRRNQAAFQKQVTDHNQHKVSGPPKKK